MSRVPCPSRDCLLPPRVPADQALRILQHQLDLSPAESVVAYLLPFGLSVKELASRTERSTSTVKRHLEHIGRRTGVCNGRELASLVTAVLWWAASHRIEQP